MIEIGSKQYGWPVIRNVADFWASRASWNAEQQRYEIVHVTSVAENYNDVPNDTFTNVSAQKVLTIAAKAAALVGERPDPHWAEVAAKLYIPFSQCRATPSGFRCQRAARPLGRQYAWAADVSVARSADERANPPQ